MGRNAKRLKVRFGDSQETVLDAAAFSIEEGNLIVFSDQQMIVSICAYAAGVWGVVEWVTAHDAD